MLTNYTIEPCLATEAERLDLYKTKKKSKNVGYLIQRMCRHRRDLNFRIYLLNHSDTVSCAGEAENGKKLIQVSILGPLGYEPNALNLCANSLLTAS